MPAVATMEGAELLRRFTADDYLLAAAKPLDQLDWQDMLLLASLPPMAGGAEIFPDEWLDHKLGQEPRNDAATFPLPATMHMGLFRGQTASTVPPRGTLLGTTAPAAVDEPSGGAYARVSMAASVWGAQGTIVTNGNGRRLTASQQTFPESTAAWAAAPTTVKGFFLANSAFGVAGKAIYYANFDDGQAIDINSAGYTVKVTPFYHVDG